MDGPRRVEGEEPPGAAASDHEREGEAGGAPMDWEEEEPGTGGRKRRRDRGIVEGAHGIEEQRPHGAAAPGPERGGRAEEAPVEEGGGNLETNRKNRKSHRKKAWRIKSAAQPTHVEK